MAEINLDSLEKICLKLQKVKKTKKIKKFSLVSFLTFFALSVYKSSHIIIIIKSSSWRPWKRPFCHDGKEETKRRTKRGENFGESL